MILLVEGLAVFVENEKDDRVVGWFWSYGGGRWREIKLNSPFPYHTGHLVHKGLLAVIDIEN